MVGPELFWPPYSGASQPYWPRLTTFKLSYASATPSGDWLLERDPRWREPSRNDDSVMSSDSDDIEPEDLPPPHDRRPDDFRTKPTEAVNEFYLAAGRAAQNMPQLRSMKLISLADYVSSDGLQHVFEDNAQHWFAYQRSEGKATWVSSGEFHVTKEIYDIWNAVAKNHGHDQIATEVSLST